MVPILRPCSRAKCSSSARRAMLPSSFRISTNTAAGFESGQQGQIDAGLGMSRASQNTARLSHQREYVARLRQVVGTGVGCHCCADGMRPVIGGDAGRDAFSRFDGYREIGCISGLVLVHHQRQSQLSAALPCQRQADQAAAEAGHEVDVFGTHFGGGHHQVALVLAVCVVHQHDHATGPDVFEQLGNGIQLGFPGHWVIPEWWGWPRPQRRYRQTVPPGARGSARPGRPPG